METVLELALRNAEKARVLALLLLTQAANTPALTYVDVGARGGVYNPLLRMLCGNQKLKVVCFDADPAACAELRTAFPNDIVIPCGVGDVEGPLPFYHVPRGWASSFLEPDLGAFSNPLFQQDMTVVKTTMIPVRRLDSLITEGAIPQPDFLKIDAQGYEINILRGLGQRIADVVGVELEAQLRPIYKGQTLFAEIYQFMRSNGFILRDLRPTNPNEYEVIEIEAFFSHDPRVVGLGGRSLKIWELLNDIPPGRSVAVTPQGQIVLPTLHV